MPARWVIFASVFFLAVSTSRAELTPDQILLITNKNVPASAELATLYAQLRHIPADRTVALDLPAQESMPFNTYETSVVVPLRQFLSDHHLQMQITCLLTFYGVPFRIEDRVNTPAEANELVSIKLKEDDLLKPARPLVDKLEALAKQVNPAYKPPMGGDDLSALESRAGAAITLIGHDINTMSDSSTRDSRVDEFNALIKSLGGDAQLALEIANDPAGRQVVQDTRAQAEKLEAQRWDADARLHLRELSVAHLGLLGTASTISGQVGYLSPSESGSATDNELALLWWGNYPRSGFLANPLNYLYPPSAARHALMVMRLDGPSPADVHRMIQTSVQIEQTGLQGCIAIDARGLMPGEKADAYSQYDELLRQLAANLREKSQIKVVLDNRPELFAPHSVNDVALYVGWYSLQHYIPGCNFNDGAIGFHIASLEMTKLHGDTSEWVHGLIGSGCVGTLGPVAEPYLGAFPNPNEFFPLLLTGRLSLAEVCWRTNPMSSWMISYIGDPLYRPYAAHPAYRVEDLPEALRAVFGR